MTTDDTPPSAVLVGILTVLVWGAASICGAAIVGALLAIVYRTFLLVAGL